MFNLYGSFCRSGRIYDTAIARFITSSLQVMLDENWSEVCSCIHGFLMDGILHCVLSSIHQAHHNHQIMVHGMFSLHNGLFCSININI